MGIIVINCFMIVLAFLAIPTFMYVYPENFGQYNADDNGFDQQYQEESYKNNNQIVYNYPLSAYNGTPVESRH